jgi:hypothetical protein
MSEEHKKAFPYIEWDKPMPANMAGKKGYLCRHCIGEKGIKGSETDRLFGTEQECHNHIESAHEHPRGR